MSGPVDSKDIAETAGVSSSVSGPVLCERQQDGRCRQPPGAQGVAQPRAQNSGRLVLRRSCRTDRGHRRSAPRHRAPPPHGAADRHLAARRRSAAPGQPRSEQLIRPGQLNLMTAGHGIAHAEEGRGSSRRLASMPYSCGSPSPRPPDTVRRRSSTTQCSLGSRSRTGDATVLVGALGGSAVAGASRHRAHGGGCRAPRGGPPFCPADTDP